VFTKLGINSRKELRHALPSRAGPVDLESTGAQRSPTAHPGHRALGPTAGRGSLARDLHRLRPGKAQSGPRRSDAESDAIEER